MDGILSHKTCESLTAGCQRFWVLSFDVILCCLMVFLDAALEFSGEKSSL